jgi:peptidoglycan/LPS O-acetylase OafA/YrhL
MFSKWPRLKPESEKFLHFDALRIIGATLVACNHWSSEMSFFPALQPFVDRMDLFSVLVDKFFILSGFIICHLYEQRVNSAGDYFSFMKKRIARVGPLHWATLGLFGLIGAVAPFIHYQLAHPDNYNFNCFVPNIFFLNAANTCPSLTFNFPSWSIGAEMACYVMLPLYLIAYRVNAWLPGLLSLAMIAVMQMLGPFGQNHEYWYDLTYGGGLLRAIPAFGVGVTLYGVREKLHHIPFAGPVTYTLYIAIVAGAFLGAPTALLMAMVYVMATCGAAADVQGKSGRFTKTLAPFGTISYSVYMLHVPLMVVLFTVVFRKLLHFPQEWMNFAIPASFPILFFVSYLSLFFFETPARRWIAGLGKKRKPAAQAPRVGEAPARGDAPAL